MNDPIWNDKLGRPVPAPFKHQGLGGPSCDACFEFAAGTQPEYHPDSDVGPWDAICLLCGHLHTWTSYDPEGCPTQPVGEPAHDLVESKLPVPFDVEEAVRVLTVIAHAIEIQWIGVLNDHDAKALRSLAARLPEMARLAAWRAAFNFSEPKAEWHEDVGPVVWWAFPVVEPPYCGTPLDDGFPEHATHFTRLVIPSLPAAASSENPHAR